MARKDKPIDFHYDTISGIGQAGFDPSSGNEAGASEQASLLKELVAEEVRE